MQVSEIIGNQATFFLISMLCGVGLVLAYDVFRIFRRLVIHGNIWIGIEDTCYWLFCTVVVFLLLYKQNDGMMRAFCFLGVGIGGAIYAFLFSRIVVKIVVKILKKIWSIVGRPILKIARKVFVAVRKQLKKLYKAIKIGLCKR